MRRHYIYIAICLLFFLIISSCNENRQWVKDGDEPSSNPNEIARMSSNIDEITKKLLEKACNFLEIDSTPAHKRISEDNTNYSILQLINPKNNQTFYLYLDLNAEEVFLLPLHDEATIQTDSLGQIVFNVMGYSREEGTVRFPYKLTCIKKDILEYDFWEGFYRSFARYWVKTDARTQCGTLYDSVELSQIVATANSVQMLFAPISTAGAAPLQEITFDTDAGICEITIFKCTAMSNPSILIPKNSCINEIIYREDGDNCIISIAYDVIAVDSYMVRECVDNDGMPITELVLGSSTDILPSELLESYSVKSVDIQDINKK